MKHWWQIFVLWVFWVLLLWLMAPCLDPRPESAPQEKLMVLVPLHCNCPWLKLRTSGCPSEMLNSSLRHHRVGEGNGFAACYGKTVEYLTGATESLTPVLWWLGMNSASGLGQMWEKLSKVIPRPSVSHFHLYCGTCALVGYPTTLRASGLSHNVNQCTAAFRMSQGHAQGFETAGNQTTRRFVYPWNASIRGSWRQLVLLLKLSGLAWTSDAPSEEVMVWEPRRSWCGGQGRFWKVVLFPSGMEGSKDQYEEEQLVVLSLLGSGVTLCVQSVSSLEKLLMKLETTISRAPGLYLLPDSFLYSDEVQPPLCTNAGRPNPGQQAKEELFQLIPRPQQNSKTCPRQSCTEQVLVTNFTVLKYIHKT
ncbi:uncharacterized protein C20orf173 homolog [Mirounga angustirostris]|uniref:uncharacterized protein C20orf173 homolog n=1 Tax=Mirounga angustirostris TaxID=9716 RepID=UPI00313CF13C